MPTYNYTHLFTENRVKLRLELVKLKCLEQIAVIKVCKQPLCVCKNDQRASYNYSICVLYYLYLLLFILRSSVCVMIVYTQESASVLGDDMSQWLGKAYEVEVAW